MIRSTFRFFSPGSSSPPYGRHRQPALTPGCRQAPASDSGSVADIEKAAAQLAVAVEAAVRKATEDPAVKVAALKVAKNAVAAAQIAVTTQANVLQATLEAMAREIAIVTERQQAKARAH